MTKLGTLADLEATSTAYWIDLDEGPVVSGEDLVFGRVTFYRRKSPDGLLPQVVDPADGGPKAVRLAVRAGAHAGPLDDPSDCVNDRCELRGPKQVLGVDVWHGFTIRVPEGFPIRPLRCVVAQMKMPYDSGGDGSPAFALRIDRGRWLATVEHLYEQCDKAAKRFLSPFVPAGCPGAGAPAADHSNFNKHVAVTDYQVRAFVATDVDGLPKHVADDVTDCTTGVRVERGEPLPTLQFGRWTDFIVHVHATGRKDVDGLIEIFVDGLFVARVTGEFGYPNLDEPPYQYFKIGAYRNNDPEWGKDVAFLDYRDIRRGASLAEVTLPLPDRQSSLPAG